MDNSSSVWKNTSMMDGTWWPQSTAQQITLLLVSGLCYLLALAVYRLYLSPLAGIPGPKIAALTSLYAAYHDLHGGGQYIFVIKEMHEKYGPIVRIRPDVIHVNDPAFVDVLYPRNPHLRRTKYKTTLRILMADGSILATNDHDLHRSRRAVLNPYFSMANVRKTEPILHKTLATLFRRMEAWARSDTPMPASIAFKAITEDVIHAYAFGEADQERCLDMEDLNVKFFAALQPVWTNHIGTHFPLFMKFMKSIPPSVVKVIFPRVAWFVKFMEGINAQINSIKQTPIDKLPEGKTIFHEILRADIPASEKETRRLSEEAMVLVIAGMETTALTLSALTYHILANPPILKRLKKELEDVMPDPNEFPSANKLDSLIYLNAVIQEGIRLHPGVSLRQDRVAPDQDLVYTNTDSGKSYRIPAGTAVGMTAPLLHQNASLYPSPTVFNPDRFLENPSLQKHNMAFSRGSRQCIGMNLAYTELQYFIAGIFRRFDAYDAARKDGRPSVELWKTERADVEMRADYVSPGFRDGAGVWLKVRLE